MAYWEFLLQKEGDRDWLPLETAHVEISEGRYRIIAHTSYCETPVEIRLSQLLAQQLPPRWKTLKRLGQTTDSGLMVVMPFTHLTPGRWTLICAPASAADEPPAWEYGVQLQVLAIESGLDDWETDLEAMVVPSQASEVDRSWEQGLTDTTSASPPISWSHDAAASPPPLPSATAPQPTLPDTASLADLPLRLQLQHQALVAQPQTAMQLQGQVTSFSQVAGLPTETTLWLQLRDPETGACIHQVAGALSLGTLPYRFDLPITLPAAVTTRLLVGELSLWTASEPPQVLAIQGFTITLNLDALLEMVANQAEQSPESVFEDLIIPAEAAATEAAAEEVTAPAKVLSPLAPREIPFRLIYLPATGLTLPPVIYRPVDRKTVGAPSLPPLANQAPRRRATSPIAQEPPAKPLTLPPLGKSRPTPVVPSPPPETVVTPGATVDLPAFGRSRPDSNPVPESLTTPSEAAAPAIQGTEPTFRPDFQGRFWDRLSALAEEAQKAAAEHQAQLEAAGVETASESPATLLPNLPFPDFPNDPATVNHEVVIYESAADEIPDASDLLADTAPPDPVVEVLSPEEPDLEDFGTIPVPQLVMPEGDLIAGAALPITVRLPQYPRRLAVKVWVTDIQSRSLADRPRWLMNWTPTDTNEQTALLQLQVPLGSLEAKFEAIAIDLATQRESYKTVQVRSILPPDLPPTELLDPL